MAPSTRGSSIRQTDCKAALRTNNRHNCTDDVAASAAEKQQADQQRKRKLCAEEGREEPKQKVPRYLASLEKARFVKKMRLPSHKYLVPPRLYTLLNGPRPSRELITKHGWDERYCSDNVVLLDAITLKRGTRAQVTDCVLGKTGFSRGFHVWCIVWPESMRGTNPVVGVAEKTVPRQTNGYVSLLGLDGNSYGWDLRRNEVLHGEKTVRKVGTKQQYPTLYGSKQFEAPRKIFCILDMDEGSLAFATEQAYLGVAFRGLQGKTLFPAVSTVWGNSTISIRYIGGLTAEAPSLFSQCLRTLRRLRDANRLPRLVPGLPPYIQGILYFQ